MGLLFGINGTISLEELKEAHALAISGYAKIKWIGA